MEELLLTVDCMATGKKLRQLIRKKGYKIREIKEATGLEDYSSVYKWMRGESLPSIEHLLILSLLLQMHIDDMLVIKKVKEPFFTDPEDIHMCPVQDLGRKSE